MLRDDKTFLILCLALPDRFYMLFMERGDSTFLFRHFSLPDRFCMHFLGHVTVFAAFVSLLV